MTQLSENGVTKEIIDWIKSENKHDVAAQKVTGDTKLLDSGLFDSMQILILVAWIETQYEVTIGVEQMTPAFFQSPGVIAQNIVKLSAAA